MRSAKRALIGVGAALWIAYAGVGGYAVPDDRLTPGQIATSDPNVICHRGYSRSQRLYDSDPEGYIRLRAAVMRAYHIAPVDRGKFELDHRVPACLAGTPTFANSWPQIWDEARVKDRIEAQACRAACREHTVEAVERWQRAFEGDWRRIRP